LVPFVCLVTWRLHSAVHSGTQRALIARFMSRANTCTHTRTHMNAACLSPSPPLVGAMHMHARAAHRGPRVAHICSYSVTRALPLPRSPSSRGPLPAGGGGPTGQAGTALPPAAFPSPCTPGTTRGDAACPRAGSRVASRPHANGHMDRPAAGPSTLCRAAHPGRAPTARSSPRLRGCKAIRAGPCSTSAP
jgi:hypothetical protein